MSYILDALRKAEDERSRKASPLRFQPAEARPRRRWPPWLAAGASVVLLPLALWLALRSPGVTPPGPGPAATLEAPATRHVPARPEPPPRPAPPSLPADQPPRASGRPAPTPLQAPAGSPSLPPSTPRRDPAPPLPKAQAVPEVPPSRPPDPPPAMATAPASKPPAGPAAPPVRPQTAPPAPPPPPSEPSPSAQEAMAKLSLTILVHTADKRDRLVYIDGKRYAEGDRVEGRYLVETIQPDGVQLTFQGERFFLRAGLGSSTR